VRLSAYHPLLTVTPVGIDRCFDRSCPDCARFGAFRIPTPIFCRNALDAQRFSRHHIREFACR